MRRIHQDNEVREELLLCDLDEIARQGARRMLIEALEAEVEEYVEAARSERDHRGHMPWWQGTVAQGSMRSLLGRER